jgi:threonine/homoserine/homoserine lactone efflux protein
MVAAITGPAALLHTSALAFQVLRYAGVVYLHYMAWSTLRDRGALTVEEEASPRSARQVIVSGLADQPGAVGRMLLLRAVFMLVTFVVFVGYGLCAAAVRSQVTSRPTVMAWIRRVFAAAFVALGARLALTDR